MIRARKSQSALGSMVVGVVLMAGLSGCGGSSGRSTGASTQERFAPSPGDELVMTVEGAGTPLYEARYRWSEMPEAESASGAVGESAVFALLEQESYQGPGFRRMMPLTDPVTREELTTFLRDHWDDHWGGTPDRGWNLEDFIGFLYEQGLSWEEFSDRWEDHHAANGTLAELVRQIAAPQPQASAQTSAVAPEGSAVTSASAWPFGLPYFVGPFYVTASRVPLFDPVLRDVCYAIDILDRKYPSHLLVVYAVHSTPNYLLMGRGPWTVKWEAKGTRRHTARMSFWPDSCYDVDHGSNIVGDLPGRYICDLTVEFSDVHVPVTVAPYWNGSVTNVRNKGSDDDPYPAGEYVVSATFLWLWQHFSRSFTFEFDARVGLWVPGTQW